MRITSLAAFALALGAAAATAFPLAVQFENNAWRVAVEPETATEIAPYSSAAVVLKDVDQLGRVLSNMAALNSLAGWGDDVGLFVCIPDAADAPGRAAEAAAAEAAAAEAAAAASAAHAAADAAASADVAAAAALAAGGGSAPPPEAPPVNQAAAPAPSAVPRAQRRPRSAT